MYNEFLPPRVGRVTWINFQPRHPGRWQSLASPGPEYCIEFWRLVSPAVSLIQRLIYHFTIWASEILELAQTGDHDPVHPDATPHKPKVSHSSLPADPHNSRSEPGRSDRLCAGSRGDRIAVAIVGNVNLYVHTRNWFKLIPAAGQAG